MINGKVYVGQTKNFAIRKAGHLCAARHGLNRYLYNAMRKYGLENFIFEVIEECVDEVVDKREQRWIAHFDSFNCENGYNLTTGGQNFSDECIQRISERTREAMAHGDPSWKLRQREAMKDPETRKLILERTKLAMQRPEVIANQAAACDEAWRAKISSSLKGHGVSEETRIKISENTKAAMSDPDIRHNISERVVAAMQRPEVKAKLALRAKPSVETRQKIAASLRARPRKPQRVGVCLFCGHEFKLKRKLQRFCSISCSKKR